MSDDFSRPQPEVDQASPPPASPSPTPEPPAPEAEPVLLEDLPAGSEPTPYQPVMERPHPLTPVIKGWMALVGMVILVGRDLLENAGKRDEPFDLRAVAVFGGMLGVYFIVTAISGYFSWRFTRFVVDDRQVRIERNFIWHNSDKVPFTKIQSVDVVQPFAARLLGLAQLRIDVGSGSGKTIDYLSRSRAYQMRDYLVARAHGQQVSVEQSNQAPVADALHDLSASETVLLTVPPQRLVLAAVLSTGFLITLALGLAGIAGIAWFQELGAAVGLVPLATGLLGIISNQVVKQWNYRLVRTGEALKVSRGMTSLVSQTLPTDRIQAISVTQHLLWRPFGIHRVKIDVLGYGGGEDEGASDVLLPAGTWAEVERAIDAVWPGFRLDRIQLQPASPRARRLHPFIFNSLRWGHDDEVFVAVNGGFVRQTEIVHHARVQSVHLQQGPVQRRLGLADVRLDTTSGILDGCIAQELDAATAREVVLAQMERSRASRERDARRAAQVRERSAAQAPEAMPAPAGWPAPQSTPGGEVAPAVTAPDWCADAEAPQNEDEMGQRSPEQHLPQTEGADWVASGSTTVMSPHSTTVEPAPEPTRTEAVPALEADEQPRRTERDEDQAN
ncbi:PH domain-containing protein [Luteococcus peritonei]|uniref:PH domain-containing protein n=1 Tax=Luteococcus peritonei TaxID=88874 RepID=A0ABW4RSQ4_9ACTN